MFEITNAPLGTLVNVIFLGLAWRYRRETKKQGETKCNIQSRPSLLMQIPRDFGLSPVSFRWPITPDYDFSR